MREAVTVEVAVDHRWQSHDRRAHALLREADRVVRGVGPRTAGRLVVLGARATVDPGHREHQRAARRDERFVGADQCLAHRLDRCEVGVDRAHELTCAQRLVLEGEVDDPVRLGGCLGQRVEVVEVAAADFGAERGHGLGGRVRTGEADDLVAVGEQLGNDG
jgi:hypothetical protein